MAGNYSDIDSFPSEWPLVRIGDFANVKGGKRLPTGTALVHSPTRHPYLRIVDLKDGRVDKSSLMYVPDDVFPRIARYTISSKDVYVSIVGTIGLVGSVDQELDGANLTENAAKICNIAPTIDRDYLVAFLRSSWGQQQISALTVGSTQPKLALFRIEDIRVPVPPLAEQRAIASLLGALDDKIELNRQMNETLEAVARLFFKDWFVDFGPTRTKVEDRPPYLAPELWALFPDALDDEDKPVGWEESTVGESFRLMMGQSPPGDTYNKDGDGLPFFQGRTDFGFRYPKRRMFCNAPTRIAEPDDTLVSVRAPVGDLNMAWERCCIGRGVAAIRHRSGGRSYTYYAILSIQGELSAFEHTGTVFGAINKTQFENLRILVPGDFVLAAFEDVVRPLDDQIHANEAENKILAQTRDLLLPKLISGEIRLRDAEKMVEAVA